MNRCRPNPLRFWIVVLAAWGLAWLATSAQPGSEAAVEPKPPATVAELQGRLTELISQPKFAAAMWGIKVLSLDTAKTLFEHNSQKLFSPASNSKLYTVALGLDRLGPDYRIRTSLYAKGKPDANGTLKGDLVVYGRGDPTINARLHSNDIFQALAPLVSALTNAGLRHISGDLVGDCSFIRGPEFGSGWCWDDQEYYYGAEISALTINDNILVARVKPGDHEGDPGRITLSPPTTYLTISNRTDTVAKDRKRSVTFYRLPGENLLYVTGQVPLEDGGVTEDVTMHNPAGLFVLFFKEALARHGIRLDGQVRTENWLDRRVKPVAYDQWEELGAQESLPVRDLAREIQKPSQNLYTDLLLAHVGEKKRGASTPAERTSEELGIRELDRFLTEVGIRPGEVIFEEGSGLSRDNLATPNATVALLQHMSRHRHGEVYLQALPVAGVDGSLRNRMKGTPAAGNLRAKTGTLHWANSLSGYVTSAAGERLVFSVMLNRYHNVDPNRSIRAELDTIGVMLAGLSGKSAE